MLIDMHDYQPRAKAFWWLTVAVGAVVLAWAFQSLLNASPGIAFEILFGAIVAAMAGLFAARIPGTKTSGGAAEVVLFLLLLELGTATASLAAAAEAGAISWRTSKRWTSRLFSPAMAAVAMSVSGSMFELSRLALPPEIGSGAQVRYVLILAFALIYFATNTLLMATLPKLKRGEPLHPIATLREHAWLALVYAASGSVALLLQALCAKVGVPSVLAAGPCIAVFGLMLHVYFKRAEERERFQAERLANAEQAAAEAARHVEELEQSEQRFQSAFAHAAVGMLLTTPDGRVLQTNSSLERLLGRKEGTVAGGQLGDLFLENEREVLKAEIGALVSGAESAFVTELRCLHGSGVEVVAAVSGSLFALKAPVSQCLILQFQDITARTRAEAHLQYIASHDSLTDLANRNCFVEALSDAIKAAERHPDRRFAVLFLDFDRFKLVNDSLGHRAGDDLLKGIARRLRKLLRPTDLVSRFGGDEFAILIQAPQADQEGLEIARRVKEVIAQPIQVNGVAISTSASIGITTSAFGYDSPEQVIRDADIAMYSAKARGPGQFAVFDSTLHSRVADRLWLEAELRRAILQEELSLFYQPIYDCTSRALVGFEVLSRWNHHERGHISPEVFIRIAEETGLIVPLGTWALRTACRTLGRWRASMPESAGLSMHVNVSGVQLAQPDFPAIVRNALRESGVEAGQLVIEVTESILIEKHSVAIPHLEELRNCGVAISLDDFGTGYSSFSMLHQLPVDEIKIDRSFVDRLGVSERGDAIVATMLALGRTLGKTMVAEGIETESQLAALVAMGCRHAQGFLLGRPSTLAAADEVVKATLPKAKDAGIVIKLPDTRASAQLDSKREAMSTRRSAG